MDKKQLWQAVSEELKLTLSKPTFSAWFNQTQINKINKLSKRKQQVEIIVPNSFIQETLEGRYKSQIKEIIDRITDKENTIVFTVKLINKRITKEKTLGPLFSKDLEKQQELAVLKAIRRAGLREDFTFKNFAVSSTNEVAYAAAQSVAKNPGKMYQLLFLYGGVGVGKTHLMQAIGHIILEKNPQTSVVYCTGEEFTNEIIQAIQTKTTQFFRQKYRSAKTLLIDDIQFIGGKDAVQEEFFHTFNTIYKAKGQVILTSDRLPHEIEGLEDRLRSRFEGGLSIDIQQPNFELRTAILLIKANQWKQSLPMDAAQMIAANFESTRALEGFLMRLITESLRKGEPISPSMVQSLLGEKKDEKELRKNIKPEEILEKVCLYFDLKLNTLKGQKRKQEIVVPRQIAMYLLKTELKLPFIKIGEIFGGKDHTTVMYAVEKIGKQMTISESLRLDINTIHKNIFGKK